MVSTRPATNRRVAQRRYPTLGRCEHCHAVPAVDRHHRDGNTAHNQRANLLFVCRRCHMLIDGRLAVFLSTSRTRQGRGPVTPRRRRMPGRR